MNFFTFLGRPRRFSTFRYGNITRDWPTISQHFAKKQWWKVYGRVTARCKYHPQQRFQNAIHKCDANDYLAGEMEKSGNAEFYKHVRGNWVVTKNSHVADLTKLRDLTNINASAIYLFNEVQRRSGAQSAAAARGCFERGFSRPIAVAQASDWEKFRQEMRNFHRVVSSQDEDFEKTTLCVAVSYKGKEETLNRRVRLLNEDGSPDYDSGILLQEKEQITSDFVDDFRWSQLIRSCKAIARKEGKTHVRLWIDRLVMMGLESEEISRIYGLTPWEEFGLLPYAVCPVVRLYDRGEPYFGTDFWRRLETVLGVAGRGLIVDDYMLRKYDNTIFYGPSLYRRIEDGLSCIGGSGKYIRSTTLALATALLTDGVSVSQSNEDMRTKAAAGAWKASALRTIAEGAYSINYPVMISQQNAFKVGPENFQTIAFWESIVCRSIVLEGNSYMDTSFQKSMQWSKSSAWDGVIEWIGMMDRSCEVENREEIIAYLTHHTKMRTFVTTTGHVASVIKLRSADGYDKRTIVVNLSRFPSSTDGHVTAVAEATGLWNSKISPWYMEDIINPDADQTAEISEDGIQFEYKPMKRVFLFVRFLSHIFLLLASIASMVAMGMPLSIGVPSISVGLFVYSWP